MYAANASFCVHVYIYNVLVTNRIIFAGLNE